MRPDVTELLGGVRRILEEAVAPEVGAPYASDVLQGALATLLALERGWARVLPFLAWDNAATAALLRRVRDAASEPLAQRIDETLRTGDPDPLDVAAVSARNEALRALLADLLASADEAVRVALAPHREDLVLHLEERARRTPIRLVPHTPGRPARKEP